MEITEAELINKTLNMVLHWCELYPNSKEVASLSSIIKGAIISVGQRSNEIEQSLSS